MKKLILLSLVLVLTVALSISVFQTSAAGSQMAGKVCPNIGWNSRSSCMANSTAGAEQLAFDFYKVPSPQPCIGWNS